MEKVSRVSAFSRNLSDLRSLWLEKKITSREIKKKLRAVWATPEDYTWKGKKLFDFVQNISEDMSDKEVEIFGQCTDFALYYDLERDEMIGPLTLGGVAHCPKDGKHVNRWLRDAELIDKLDSDETKVQIYAK